MRLIAWNAWDDLWQTSSLNYFGLMLRSHQSVLLVYISAAWKWQADHYQQTLIQPPEHRTVLPWELPELEAEPWPPKSFPSPRH